MHGGWKGGGGSTGRDSRSRSLQRMVRRCGHSSSRLANQKTNLRKLGVPLRPSLVNIAPRVCNALLISVPGWRVIKLEVIASLAANDNVLVAVLSIERCRMDMVELPRIVVVERFEKVAIAINATAVLLYSAPRGPLSEAIKLLEVFDYACA